MAKKANSLADQIRAAVLSSGESRNAICKRAGIDPAAILRFMAGSDIRLETAEKLATALGLQLNCKRKAEK